MVAALFWGINNKVLSETIVWFIIKKTRKIAHKGIRKILGNILITKREIIVTEPIIKNALSLVIVSNLLTKAEPTAEARLKKKKMTPKKITGTFNFCR